MPEEAKEAGVGSLEEATSSMSAATKAESRVKPQQLYGEVIPHLISLAGDVKSGRIAAWMVEQYLDRHTLIFNRVLLHQMFEEADFRKEGSLDERALAAALSGRYPKRQLTEAWRQLVALLFDIPQLILQEEVVVPKMSKGTFNSETFWDRPAPSLPPIGKLGETKASAASGELRNHAAMASSTVNLGPETFAALDAASPLRTLEGGLNGMASLPGASAIANQTLLSSRGVQTVGPTEEELAIYRSLLQGGSNRVPRSTFATVREFNKFADGHEAKAQMSVEANWWANGPGRDVLMQSLAEGGPTTSYSSSGVSLPGIHRSASSPASTMGKTGGSALQTLRKTIMSGAYMTKPEFVATHQTLGTSDADRKKTLGRTMDMSESLARVEPTRPTNLRYQDDYVAVGDYAPNCRTAPSQWDQHPKAPAHAKQATKYPWGNWT